jgi:uncharacterized surface protein with fasciclin (FAS1) repeats
LKSMRTGALSALLLLAALPYLALAQEHPTKTEHPTKAEHPAKATHPAAAGDIVAVASGAGNFKTLVAAIKAAGLVETLQGKGPFTVFAPTDEAFAKLPAGTLDELLKPENKTKLAAILNCHVVPGKVMAADVKTMKAKTVGGQELSLKVEGKSVTVDGAKVIKTDIAATNGVIHVIDTVIMPAAAGAAAPAKHSDHPGH